MIELDYKGTELHIHLKVDKLDASNAETIKTGFKAADVTSVSDARIFLEKVQFLDSSGVGALLSIYKTLQVHSANVTLVNPTPAVQSVLELLRLHRIFTIQMD